MKGKKKRELGIRFQKIEQYFKFIDPIVDIFYLGIKSIDRSIFQFHRKLNNFFFCK